MVQLLRDGVWLSLNLEPRQRKQHPGVWLAYIAVAHGFYSMLGFSQVPSEYLGSQPSRRPVFLRSQRTSSLMKSLHFAFKNQKSQRFWGQICCVLGSAVSIGLVTLYIIPQSDFGFRAGLQNVCQKAESCSGVGC